MALIKKITLSNTTYDVGADANNIAYNSNSSVKDKIDGYEEIVPSSASGSNKLATTNDIPSLTNYIEKSQTTGLVKNDGTIDTNTYLTSVPTATSSALGLVKPDNSTITVDAKGTITASADTSNCIQKSATEGLVKNDGSIDTNEYAKKSEVSAIKKTRYTVTATNWSNSVDANGYYTYTITLNPTLSMDYAPNVDIAGVNDSTFSTDAEKEAYDLLDECNLTTTSTLILYAKTKPETTFYIWVEGEVAS